jgi:hypothetical protein
MGSGRYLFGLAFAAAVARFTPLREFGSILVFIAVFSVQLMLYLTYILYLYPYVLSPLRHLPSPKVFSS